MQYYSYLIFIVALSGFNFITLILVLSLDFLSVSANQKIKIIKIGIIMLGIAPLLFILCKFSSYQILNIPLHDKLTRSSTSTAIVMITYKINWSSYIFFIYSTGFVFMLSQIVLSYWKARGFLADSVHTIIQKKSVFLNKKISSPLNFGFPKSKIYLPENIEDKWSPREISLSLAHEQIHLDNNDGIWKLFSLIARAMLFFAPWAYLLHRKFSLEMEILCDKQTCITKQSSIKEYGDLLIAMSCVQPKNLIFTHISNSILKRRFLAMKLKNRKYPLLIFILSIFLILAAGGTTIAIANSMNSDDDFDITSKIFVDGKLLSSPRIITHKNQPSYIVLSSKDGSSELKMKAIAYDTISLNKNAIKIDFDFQYKKGKELINTKPQFIVQPNQEARIIQFVAGHQYEMTVIAKK